MWYLCFLPLVLPKSTLITSHTKFGILLLLSWISGQALWLYYAYQLEHLGYNTFVQLWISSIVFYSVQIAIIVSFILYKQLDNAI
jgi:phosphatidylinositol glycan class M